MVPREFSHSLPSIPPTNTESELFLCDSALVASGQSHKILLTFPNVRVGLLVGIGAGIPDYEYDDIQDVRLGDVVISSDKENGGVVLYDFGKSLRTAISRACTPWIGHLGRFAQRYLCENRIPQYINQMLKNIPI
jgi:hypothetical protein